MNENTKHPTLLILPNMAAYVTVIVVNYLSNALPLNGRTAGEISDALPSFFTPAGYTFSVWGLIYLALLGFVVYQALPAQRTARFRDRIGWLFIASSMANVGWLFAWHYGFYWLSVLVMLALLALLIAIYVRLKVGLPGAAAGWREKIFVHLPFSLYLGWITVATIANISSVAAHSGWDGFGISGPIWSAIMIFAAAVVAGVLLLRRSDPAYSGVLIWALFGIRAAHSATPLIANSALVAAGLIALFTAVAWNRNRRVAARRGYEAQTHSA